jgi:hypothetical protein
MYIFGGIFELTKELNDLASYDFMTSKWESLESEAELAERTMLFNETEVASPTKSGVAGSPLRRKTIVAAGTLVSNSTMKKRGTMSPMKTKAEINVTVTASETPSAILASPTSLTMKNSFILINSDESFDNYKIAKQNKRGFFEKLEDEKAGEATQFGFVAGSKPTPRDGHSATVDSQGNMYVFGGDRHHMPFNDLYMLKLD